MARSSGEGAPSTPHAHHDAGAKQHHPHNRGASGHIGAPTIGRRSLSPRPPLLHQRPMLACSADTVGAGCTVSILFFEFVIRSFLFRGKTSEQDENGVGMHTVHAARANQTSAPFCESLVPTTVRRRRAWQNRRISPPPGRAWRTAPTSGAHVPRRRPRSRSCDARRSKKTKHETVSARLQSTVGRRVAWLVNWSTSDLAGWFAGWLVCPLTVATINGLPYPRQRLACQADVLSLYEALSGKIYHYSSTGATWRTHPLSPLWLGST